jgi:deazaflavin-dependent oxidoreductase (nitroreductase family)
MTASPNAFQKLLHQIVMLRPATVFFAPWVHRLDKTILKLTRGEYAVSEILGWNIIQLTTLGVKTGQLRTVPLVGLFDGEKIALIASSFGREHNPGWYYNLKKNPECEVQYRGHSRKLIARETEGAEREKYWRLALDNYIGYEKYKEHAGRRIPVMILQPKS